MGLLDFLASLAARKCVWQLASYRDRKSGDTWQVSPLGLSSWRQRLLLYRLDFIFRRSHITTALPLGT